MKKAYRRMTAASVLACGLLAGCAVVGDPGCACTHAPTAQPNGITGDQVVEIAKRSTPGVTKDTVVDAVEIDNTFGPSWWSGGGPTPDPRGDRNVYVVRLSNVDLPVCATESMTRPSATARPCVNGEGRVTVAVDVMTGTVLGWMP